MRYFILVNTTSKTLSHAAGPYLPMAAPVGFQVLLVPSGISIFHPTTADSLILAGQAIGRSTQSYIHLRVSWAIRKILQPVMRSDAVSAIHNQQTKLSQDYNDISTKLLTETITYILLSITRIINRSSDISIAIRGVKRTNVILIQKSSDQKP